MFCIVVVFLLNMVLCADCCIGWSPSSGENGRGNSAMIGQRGRPEFVSKQRESNVPGLVLPAYDRDNVRQDNSNFGRAHDDGRDLPGTHHSCSNQRQWIPSRWGETFSCRVPCCCCHKGTLMARCCVATNAVENRGRCFYRCGHDRKECSHWQWVDEWERSWEHA